jgi:hypothetical protein
MTYANIKTSRLFRLLRYSWKRYLRLVRRPLTDDEWLTNQLW